MSKIRQNSTRAAVAYEQTLFVVNQSSHGVGSLCSANSKKSVQTSGPIGIRKPLLARQRCWTGLHACSRMRRRSPSGSEPDPSLTSVDSFVRWLALDPVLAAVRHPVDLIVEKLAQVLNLECVFVGELLDVVPERVRAVAWWKDGRLGERIEYSAAGSPCEPVVAGRPSYCPFGVTRRYAEVGFQKAERIEAYAAHPLTGLDGTRLGLISVMSRHRFKDGRRVRQLLAACAPRLAGEIARLRQDGDRPRARDAADTQYRVREHQLLETVREQEMLLREVHHRVKNSLQIVASLLTMQARATSEESVKRELSDATNRISTIALIHAQLSEGPNLASVEMGVFIRGLIGNVQRAFADSTVQVAFSLRLDELTLPIRLAIPCGLILNELVTNAFEHAFGGASSGLIEVRLTVYERRVTIVVRDDGPGLPRQGQEHEGVGMQLVRLLAVKQLRGDVFVARRGGTEVTVSFPRGG